MSSIAMKQYDGKFKKGTAIQVVANNFLEAAEIVWNHFNSSQGNITALVDVIGIQLSKENVIVNTPNKISVTVNIRDSAGSVVLDTDISGAGLFAGPQITEMDVGKEILLIAHINNTAYNAQSFGFENFYDVTDPSNPIEITAEKIDGSDTWQAYTTPQAGTLLPLTQKIYEARFTIA
jgi:hypothetical protein